MLQLFLEILGLYGPHNNKQMVNGHLKVIMENILLDAMDVSLGVQLLITLLFTIHHPVIHGHNGKLNTNLQNFQQETLIYNPILVNILLDVINVDQVLITIQLPSMLKAQIIHGLYGLFNRLEIKLPLKLTQVNTYLDAIIVGKKELHTQTQHLFMLKVLLEILRLYGHLNYRQMENGH
jgi:hypothetical protein